MKVAIDISSMRCFICTGKQDWATIDPENDIIQDVQCPQCNETFKVNLLWLITSWHNDEKVKEALLDLLGKHHLISILKK